LPYRELSCGLAYAQLPPTTINIELFVGHALHDFFNIDNYTINNSDDLRTFQYHITLLGRALMSEQIMQAMGLGC